MDGALPACSARLPESDYLCVTNTHRGQEGWRTCVCARAGAASLKANLRAWPSGGRAESNAAGQSPASKHPSHSVTFHYQRVILIKETVKGVK